MRRISSGMNVRRSLAAHTHSSLLSAWLPVAALAMLIFVLSAQPDLRAGRDIEDSGEETIERQR